MRNKLQLFLALIFLQVFSYLYSQTTVIIGANNGANGTTGYPCPLQDWYTSQRGQYLYDAASISMAGIPSGATITSVGWIVNSTGISGHQMEDINIYLKNTNITNVSASFWETGLTQVYGPGGYSYVPNSTGAVTATINPFVYTGGGLLLELCSGNTAASYSQNPAVQWTNVSYNASHQFVDDNVIGCGNTNVTNDANTFSRPRLQITYTISAVNSPTSISGTPSICQGGTSTLTVNGSSGTTYWFTGSCGSSIATSIGSGTSINVSPTVPTTYYARNYNNGIWSTSCASYTVSVGSAPSIPSNPTSNSPQCNSVTITRVGTPPAGTTWYWQGTNANGTSTTLGSGATYTATATGTYYIRAFNSSGCWSSGSGGIAVVIGGQPANPSNPTSNSPQCNSITITRVGTPPAGTTWYWQGTNANGTSTALGSGATYTATASGTYYIRALNSNGCWSSGSGSVTVTIGGQPSNPSNPTSNSPQCNSVTLTRVGTPPAGTTWYWQGTNANGTSTTLGSGTTYTATASGTYYIRAMNNSGCWSTGSGSIAVTIGGPADPSNPTSNSPQCNSVTLTRVGAPPAGVTWYWQGTNANGTSTALGSGATYTATASGTYYIRALNASGCWSGGSGAVTITISGIPSTPTNPTSNSPQCNSATITRVGNPPAGATWYWQGTNAFGTSTTLGSGATYTAATSGTYYLRSLSSGGCWSDASGSVVVTVLPEPSNPTNPTSNSPQCNLVTLTRSGLPPTGTTWYWQGTTANGTSTTIGSGATYSATNSGTYYLRALNQSGCWSSGSGSVAVTINPSYTVSEAIVACGSYTWINGVTYTESTSAPSFNLQTAQGCDSLIYLDLTIGQPLTDSTYIQTSAIGSYTLNGTTYTETGVYYQTLINQSGCDSTIVLDLVFDSSVLTSIDSENELMLFPNPSTDGIFNILMPEEAEIIAITDVHGKLIKYAYLDGKLNVPQVTGIYFLTLKHLNRLQTYKLVVM